MPCFLTVKVFALKGLLKLDIVCSVKVYKAFIVTIGCLVSLFFVVTLERLTNVSLLSGVSNYKLINKLLSLTLYVFLIKFIIDTYYKLDIIYELA